MGEDARMEELQYSGNDNRRVVVDDLTFLTQSWMYNEII